MAVYEMQYRGGFAIPSTIADVVTLMRMNDDVEISESASLADAYVKACRKYVVKELDRNPYLQPVLPRFEDVLQIPYHAPAFVEQVPTKRMFAILNRDYVGIFTSVETSVEFLNTFHPCWLKEFTEYDAALRWIHLQFMRRLLPVSAYCSGQIPYIQNLPLDMAIAIPYVQWLAEHYVPDPRLSFGSNFLLESQNLLPIDSTAEPKNQEDE